jgi:hypothetical protein
MQEWLMLPHLPNQESSAGSDTLEGAYGAVFWDRVDRARDTVYDDANRMNRSSPAARLASVWLIGALFLSGCSLIFTKSAPAKWSTPDVECSTSRVPPILDTILGLSHLGGAIWVAVDDRFVHRNLLLASELAFATVFAVSAIYGYRQTSACEEIQDGIVDFRMPAEPELKRKPPVPREPDPNLTRAH